MCSARVGKRDVFENNILAGGYLGSSDVALSGPGCVDDREEVASCQGSLTDGLHRPRDTVQGEEYGGDGKEDTRPVFISAAS